MFGSSLVPFAAKLYEQNSDIVGWIRIDDTHINYPVMQSPQEQFDGVIQRAKEKAFYDTGVSAEYGDKFITLSACEYSGQNSRLVVVAKKVTESGGSNVPSNDGTTEMPSYCTVLNISNS